MSAPDRPIRDKVEELAWQLAALGEELGGAGDELGADVCDRASDVLSELKDALDTERALCLASHCARPISDEVVTWLSRPVLLVPNLLEDTRGVE